MTSGRIGAAAWGVWVRSGAGSLGLSSAALLRMSRHIQHSSEPEAGGILLGRRLLDSMDVLVDSVTTPFPSDIQERRAFVRNAKGHQDAVDSAWEESQGTTVYLGEWHTHPQARPEPSRTDLCDWRRKSGEDSYRLGLFFVIVGFEELAVWEIERSGDDPTRLTKRNGPCHG